MNHRSIPGKDKTHFLASRSFTSAVRPTQLHIKGIPAALTRDKSDRNLKLTTRPLSIAEFKHEWSCTSVPHTPSWGARGYLYL
jgi:hypothetical protein